MRSLLLLIVILGGVAAACTIEDRSNPLRTKPGTASNATEPTDDDDGTGPNGTGPNGFADDGGATSSTNDASTGADAKPPPDPGAFLGAQAYAATVGPTTRKPQHNFAGNTPTTNPAGRPCLQCHGAAGPAPRFAFAGTITKNGTQPAPNVEVRIIDANNKAVTAYTNADGNFFIPFATSGALAFPVKGGARDADTTKLMKGTAANGNCN